MSVLVTTGDSLKALTVVRSLGRKGISVTTGSHSPVSLSSYSRYTATHISYPSPASDSEGFLQNIVQYLKKEPQDVLMPVHSGDTMILAKNRKLIEQLTHFPFHAYDQMVLLNDKAELARIAEELDIPHPRTWIPERLEQIKQISHEIRFPAVIKLRNRTSSLGQSYVYHPDDLYSVYRDTIQAFSLQPQEYPIVQEYVSGVGYGVSLLFNRGDLRAQFTHKRIREFPSSGGPSTCRISTKNSVMENHAIRLLSHFSWHGLAMVEFKLTPEGVPFLLEVNPRIWGSINQAVQSGVDFPYLLYQMAVDGDVKPVLSYREGVVTRNTILDMCSYVQAMTLKKSNFNKNSYLQIPFHDDIFARDDPIPFFRAFEMGIKEIRKTYFKNKSN